MHVVLTNEFTNDYVVMLFQRLFRTQHFRAIIYWVYNSVMVLPGKKFKIDFSENSYR